MWTVVCQSGACVRVGLLIAVCALPAALGQGVAGQHARPASATLPESNEAELLSGRAADAIERGEYRLALRLIDQIMQLPAELVAAPGTRTYYPARYEAYRLLRQLPPAGVELYRQMHDAEVEARFRRAARTADIETLWELFRVYRLSTSWPAVGRELAAQLLDWGTYGEALGVLRELVRGSANGNDPGAQALLVAALGQVDAWRSAERALMELKAHPLVDAQPAWRARAERIEGWLAARGPGGRAAAGRRTLSPHIAAAPLWSRSLEPADGRGSSDDEIDLAVAIGYLRRLPLHEPALDDDVLVVRLHGTVRAFDALTLTPLWRTGEHERPDAAVRMEVGWPRRRGGGSADEESGVTPEARVTLLHALRHSVSTGAGYVFTIEGLALDEAEDELFGRPVFRGTGDRVAGNELVARHLHTGEPAWRTGTSPAHPLFGVAFQDGPVVAGNKLVAPFVRGSHLNLAVLEPSSGRLIREIPIVGPPTRFTLLGGRCRIVADETTLYVCTGNGVIAAFGLNDLDWRWALVYPSSLGEHLGRVWWQAEDPLPESGVDRPVIVDDLLIVAPVDCREIIAVARFSGRQRWRVPRGEHAFVIGAVDAGLLVVGQAITCLDPADGRTVRWRSVPLELSGRPAIAGERIYVPTRGGLVVLDGRTGKLIADQALPGEGLSPRVDERAGTAPATIGGTLFSQRIVSANLLVSNDALFAVSPGRIVKYPDLSAARERCVGLLERDVAAERAALTLAWLDFFAGDLESALGRLEEARPADDLLAANRDALLGHVCVALAGASQAGAGQLSWLRRAAAFADTPDAAARLAALIGKALEDGAHWDEALAHYRDVLLRTDVGYARVVGDEQRRVAGWLLAVERIRAILPQLPVEQSAGFLDDSARATTTPERDVAVLQRLRLMFGDPARRAPIDSALTLAGLPPEVAIDYLPTRDDPTQPAGARRRLQLARWDTHVALGQLDQARADEALWQEHFGAATEPGFEESESERRRIDRIRLAMRKLEQSQGTPFTAQFRRQWLLREAELIVDPADVGDVSSAGWILLRHLQDRQIGLHGVVSGTPLRQTYDGVRGGAGGEQQSRALQYGVGRLLFSGGSGGRWRARWPVLRHGYLAAVPVRGALLCVGLGPERGGGGRLWEFPVAEWGEVPVDFARKAVATPLGVCFAPRPDRVLLVAWADGQLCWQREWPGHAVARLQRAGDTLIVTAEDQEVLALDALTGGRRRGLPAELGTPLASDVVGDRLCVWGAGWVAGLDPASFAVVWRRPCGRVGAHLTVPQRGWVVFRGHGETVWAVLDARSGEAVLDLPLPEVTELTGLAVEGDVLYVAGWGGGSGGRQTRGRSYGGRQVSGPTERGADGVAHLAAFDLSDGRLLWATTVETAVKLNATQLAAHCEFVPLLLLRGDVRPSDAIDLNTLAIQLIEKRTGRALEAVSIGSHFRPTDASCDVFLLATPTRLIVQAAGNVVAFGNSELREGP